MHLEPCLLLLLLLLPPFWNFGGGKMCRSGGGGDRGCEDYCCFRVRNGASISRCGWVLIEVDSGVES